MKIDYDYHIKVNGKVIFLGSTLMLEYEGSSRTRIGILERIGPAGIYMSFPGLKNAQFINYKKIKLLEEV